MYRGLPWRRAGPLADAAQKGSPERARGYEEAAQHYRKAVNLTASTAEKIQALDKMAALYEVKHLNLPQPVGPILRELIAELVINESGDVSDAKIVRSVPLLDDAG